jgi:hypothetical protein
MLTCPNNRRRINLFLLTDPMSQQLPAGYFSRLEQSATELSTLETLLLQFPAANKLHICIRMKPYSEEADVLDGALCKRSLDIGVSPSALFGQITELTIEATEYIGPLASTLPLANLTRLHISEYLFIGSKIALGNEYGFNHHDVLGNLGGAATAWKTFECVQLSIRVRCMHDPTNLLDSWCLWVSTSCHAGGWYDV